MHGKLRNQLHSGRGREGKVLSWDIFGTVLLASTTRKIPEPGKIRMTEHSRVPVTMSRNGTRGKAVLNLKCNLADLVLCNCQLPVPSSLKTIGSAF
jgi:hypothetical protein